MPFFWQIDATQWLNPTHIFHIEDLPRSHPPRLRVWMTASETSELGTAAQSRVLVLEGEARDTLLAYLARETESPPPPPLA